MVTRLELGGKNLVKYLERRGINHTGDRFILGEFDDKSGIYRTATGMVGLEFDLKGGNNKVITLFCEDAGILRGKGRERKRSISIGNSGVGAQQLTKGVDLHALTQATTVQFKAKK